MSITGLTYLAFLGLACVLAGLVKAPRRRQVLFLVASYLFYASFGLRCVILLLLSSLVNWWMGGALKRRTTPPILWSGVAFNVFLLAVFKYLPASTTLAPLRGFSAIGISFWTFQAISYLFDVYREEDLDPTLLECCLFLSFWPTVLSGPIARMPEMLPQFRRNAALEWDDVATGVQRIVIGLFMKLVVAGILADGLQPGQGVNYGFDSLSHGWTGLDAWALAVGYGLQLYFDFAGYSNIVIGSARLFGIRLPENFSVPFLATSPSNFWQRWHMSLSFWIRDYVFLPLATLRREPWWRHVSLILAMMLFGLWHGPRVLFVVWGAYHGVLLVAHRWMEAGQKRIGWRPGTVASCMGWLTTMTAISLGWIFFRASDWAQASAMLRVMTSAASYRHTALPSNYYLVLAVIMMGYAMTVVGGTVLRKHEQPDWLSATAEWLSPVWYAAIGLLIVCWSGQRTLFVYFQF